MYFLCEQVDDGGYVLAAAPHVRQLPEQRGGQVAGGDGGTQGARLLYLYVMQSSLKDRRD